jgi:hypothetical protein
LSQPNHAPSPLRQAFNKAFARGFVIFAAGAASLAQAQEPANTPIPDIYAEQAAQQDAARSKFTDLVRAADPAGYGARLARLEENLNNYLRRHSSDHPRHDSVVVLNPVEVDISLIVDQGLGDMIRSRVAARRGSVSDERIEIALPAVQDTMVTAGGTSTFTQMPGAVLQMPENGRATCIIIPVAEHDKAFGIPGLTPQQMEDYLNLHEGWHCLDLNRGATAEQKDAMTAIRTLADLRGSVKAQEALAAVNQQEALADVGAVGDMIRAGTPPRLLGHVINWRNSPAEADLEHITVPALQALEKHINTVGLKAFRAMDDKTAAQLYIRLAEENALSQPRLQAALDNLFDPKPASDATQAHFNQRLEMVQAEIKRGSLSPVPPGTAEKAERLRGALENWNARDVLEREAMRRHGEITLENLVYAYGGLKAQLQNEIKAGGPAAEVRHEQLSRLRIELVIMGTQEYDFVDANRRHAASAAAPAAAAPQRSAALQPAPR